MRTTSLYSNPADFDSDILNAITDVSNEHAPQQGIHLYHFPGSLCSQKARQVLEEAQVKWTSHVINLNNNDQYDPAYVRINPRCVVPTLVVDGKVTTDALNIMNHVQTHYVNKSKSSLIPVDDESKQIEMEEWVTLAESLYIGALSHGKVPGVEHGGTPAKAAKPKGSIEDTLRKHAKKAKLLEDYVEKFKSKDEYLQQCYESKLRLVLLAKDTMSTENNMQQVVDVTKEAFDQLAKQLETGPFTKSISTDGGWLVSDTFSLADLLWGVVMNRLAFLRIGKELIWKEHEIVEQYAQKLFARESFQTAIVEWMKEMKKYK